MKWLKRIFKRPTKTVEKVDPAPGRIIYQEPDGLGGILTIRVY